MSIFSWWVVGLGVLAACADEGRLSSVAESVTSPTCVTIQRGHAGAVADTYIKSNALHQNYGAHPALRVSAKDESLLRFDLGAIPANAVISSATLELYVNGEFGDGTITIHRALTPWVESAVTYASFGQHFEADPIAAVRVESRTALKNIDLTHVVKRWASSAIPNNGVLLRPGPDHHPACDHDEDEDRDPTLFVSSEATNQARRPALSVCYTLATDHCSPNPCLGGGKCENDSNGYTCECPAGLTGANCEININDCAGNPCQNGGACTDGLGGYTCSCAAGFSGTNCEVDIDDCADAPCKNGGVCTDGVATFTCACATGYDGATCDHQIDNCASDPCHNGGTCQNATGGFTCQCAPGFSGTTCDTNVDDCAVNACVNGTCVDGINSYTCSCAPDWGGAHCDVNLNSCGQNPCLNGSTCTNGFGSYVCTCAPGFTGSNCEIDINDCAVNPCENGGACVDQVNGFTCMCATGFSGPTCSTNIDDCASAPCHNGGSCTDGTASFTCACPAAWSGPTCDVVVDACAAEQPCRNGGTCTSNTNGPGTFSCACPPNFGGLECELDVSQGVAVTVPNVPSSSEIPHVILAGVATTLKGRALGPVTQFKWDFGDGTPTSWTTITFPTTIDSLAAKHVYQGSPGTVFFATLSVRVSATSAAHSAVYSMQLADPASLPDPRTAIAIDEGLWYLHVGLSRGVFGATNTPYAASQSHDASCAVLGALQRHGSTINGSIFIDPYSDDVQRLLAYVFANAQTTQLGLVHPVDLNGNGIQIRLTDDDLGVCADAVALTPPTYVVPCGDARLVGKSLGALAQDLADYVMSMQYVNETGNYNGSWYNDPFLTYSSVRSLDNYRRLGATVSSQVWTTYERWLATSGYGAPTCGGWPEYSFGKIATAANTYGSLVAGVPSSQLQASFGYLDTNWAAVMNGCAGIEEAAVLALKAGNVSLLAPHACDGTQTGAGFDWYAGSGTPTGLVHLLVPRQQADGHWIDGDPAIQCYSLGDAGATAQTVSILIGM